MWWGVSRGGFQWAPSGSQITREINFRKTSLIWVEVASICKLVDKRADTVEDWYTAVHITWYMYCMWYDNDRQNINPNISRSQASYEVYIVRIWDKIDCVLAAPYCRMDGLTLGLLGRHLLVCDLDDHWSSHCSLLARHLLRTKSSCKQGLLIVTFTSDLMISEWQ